MRWFYQRFVQDDAAVAVPLTDLMKKKKVWVRGEKPEADFQDLRHQVVEVSNVDTT